MKAVMILLLMSFSPPAPRASQASTEEMVGAAINFIRAELVTDTGRIGVDAWEPSGIDAAAVASIVGGIATSLDSLTRCYTDLTGGTLCEFLDGSAAMFEIIAGSIIGTEGTTTLRVNTEVHPARGPALYQRTVAVVLDYTSGAWVVRRYEILMES